MKHISLVTALAGLTVSLMAQAAFDDYPSRSIASMLADFAPQEQNEYLQNSGDRYYEMGSAVAKSRVICDGPIRPIPAEELTFISKYFQVRKQLETAALFNEEALCSEGKEHYWLPVQGPVMSYFKKEVRPGAKVDLYVLFLGSFRSTTKALVHVVAVNEFLVVEDHK